MKNYLNIYTSPQISSLTKFWFSNYGPKFSQPIRLQDSLKCNISREKWGIKLTYKNQTLFQVVAIFCLFLWWRFRGITKVPKIISLQYLSKISEERWSINLILCMKIDIKAFYKLIPSLFLTISRHPQSTKNNKFAISLQHLKKDMWDDLFFACR